VSEVRWVRVAGEAEIAVGDGRRIEVAGRPVLLLRRGEGYLAFEAICPHQEFTLSLADIQGDTITCPLHGYQYDLCTGENLYPASVYPPEYALLKHFLRPLCRIPVEARPDGIYLAVPSAE